MGKKKVREQAQREFAQKRAQRRLRMMNMFDRLQEANKLPLGHYERTKAREAIDEEYAACQEQERKLMRSIPKKVRRYSIDPRKAKWIVDELCDLSGMRRIRGIIFSSEEVHRYSAAHYNPAKKEIHVGWQTVGVRTLLHELAHHFKIEDRMPGGMHGESFLWCERFIFDLFKKELIPKWETSKV